MKLENAIREYLRIKGTLKSFGAKPYLDLGRDSDLEDLMRNPEFAIDLERGRLLKVMREGTS